MREKVTLVLYPLITLVVVIILWSVCLELFEVPNYILPDPYSVFSTFIASYLQGHIWPHLFFTFKSTALGYFVGCGLGLTLGSLLAESRTFEKFLYIYVVILQSIPKVALAPLIIVWFGFGIESKIVMVALICFFPVFINTFVGIRQADPDLIDVLRVFSASRSLIFFHVKLPAASGSIFAGLQIAVVLGLIGAVVAEFIASQYGLGTVIQSAALELDTSLMLTGVFSLALMGVAGNLLVRICHRKVVFWEEGRSQIKTNLEVA